MRMLKIFPASVVIFYIIHSVSTWNMWQFKLPKINLKRDSYNPWCYINECCNKDWINFKRARLQGNLTKYLFGQPFVDAAVNALAAHYNPYFPSSKALTLSFHGMTGVGKNFVSKFIVDSIYRKGFKSKYVHQFIGRMHFSEQKDVKQNKELLHGWLKGNISDCPQQLIIFDEVDKMVPDILNSIKPIIDNRDDVEGVDYSKAIFIFLSNTGAHIINEHYHDLYFKEGKAREEMKISDFETFIEKVAFNEQGGFENCDLINHNLIDHYIPFLPLEEKHVIKCIKNEFMLWSVANPAQEHVEEILQDIQWGPEETKIFSKTGCRRLGQKVATLVDKHYRHIAFDNEKNEL
ncbi:torsin-1A-like [Euwallacea fornicatus]|uniref:torsin-1A-like n=1 Tax=Euwallacea fornicatus TaxID=995702 RepID=UPI00338EB40F